MNDGREPAARREMRRRLRGWGDAGQTIRELDRRRDGMIKRMEAAQGELKRLERVIQAGSGRNVPEKAMRSLIQAREGLEETAAIYAYMAGELRGQMDRWGELCAGMDGLISRLDAGTQTLIYLRYSRGLSWTAIKMRYENGNSCIDVIRRAERRAVDELIRIENGE